MKDHIIIGGGGVRLHALEAGNPDGRAILFLHGFSQSSLQWSRQLDSSLAQDHRLVALDLRGHGLSDKPHDGYGDSRLWADDVDAVIRTLGLERPVLSGWSYGPLVFLDYIRHYGEERIGGLQFVGAVTRLGSQAALDVLSPELLALVPQFFSTDTETTVAGLNGLLRLCFLRQPAMADLYLMLGYGVTTPPYVRQGLFSRVLDNDDLLPGIQAPVLITHGARDAVVKPAAVDLLKAAIPHAEVQLMAGTGHAAFLDGAPAFNERLRAFCASLPQAAGSAAMA